MPVRVKYTKGDTTVIIEFPKDAAPFTILEVVRTSLFPGVEQEAYNPEEQAKTKAATEAFAKKPLRKFKRWSA